MIGHYFEQRISWSHNFEIRNLKLVSKYQITKITTRARAYPPLRGGNYILLINSLNPPWCFSIANGIIIFKPHKTNAVYLYTCICVKISEIWCLFR